MTSPLVFTTNFEGAIVYLKQTSYISKEDAQAAHVAYEAYLRSKLSYFIYSDSSVWEKYLDQGFAFELSKGKALSVDTDYVYFVKHGLLQFSRIQNDEVLPSFYVGKNALCCEMHVIGHVAQPSHYIAVEQCSLVRFPVQFLRQLVLEKPEISFLIMESIGMKYSVLLTRINEMGSQHLLRNIARLLLDMASYHQFTHTFTPPISQRELVDFFCVHRSSVNRIIATLRDQGIVGDYTKNRIEILDYAQLIEIASVSYK